MQSSRRNEEGVRRINRADDDYPSLLKEIGCPPHFITVRGSLPPRNMPCIAIVGTRRATAKGMALAKSVARDLASRGAAIVSGLALGIDTASHEGAIDGGGGTIAILPCGIDRVYPRQNAHLAERIVASGGALITEYELGTTVFPSRFLERNRIISGMSIATVVIEAPRDSGALVTARTAAEAGREVLVFPGPSDHPNYAGSHALLRDGARLAGSVSDILEDIAAWTELYPLASERAASDAGRLPEDGDAEQKVLSALAAAGKPLSADDILEAARLDIQALNVALSTLVLKEIIIEGAGGRYELGHR